MSNIYLERRFLGANLGDRFSSCLVCFLNLNSRYRSRNISFAAMQQSFWVHSFNAGSIWNEGRSLRLLPTEFGN
jgi:hypothetical protein